MTRYEEIYKDKIEFQLQQRYHREITALQSLGFDELYHTREVVFPFSALLMFWIYPALKMSGELVRVENPLRYVLLNPLLFNREYDTYAHIFGMGTKFGTLFMDGTVLITTNYPTTRIVKPDRKLYRYSRSKKTAIQYVWDEHVYHISTIEAKGRETNPDLSIDNFEAIMQRDDKALIFGR